MKTIEQIANKAKELGFEPFLLDIKRGIISIGFSNGQGITIHVDGHLKCDCTISEGLRDLILYVYSN